MKFNLGFFKKDLLLWVLLIVIIPNFFSLLRPGFFPMQDDLQAFRIQQMYKCFVDFQIPCRWVPDAGYQYGYPQFLYYPPSVYYLGAFFHLFGIQFIDSVKILFILGFVLSSVFMYLFLKTIVKPWPAFVGAVLYSYVPYKAVEVYVRGAMSEFWSLVAFPLIFWAITKVIKSGQIRHVPFLALSIGFLLTTHNLMALIFSPVIAVWSLMMIILEKRWKSIWLLVLGGVLGIGLASFFTLPVLFEKQYAHLESLLGGYFDYRQHFVDLNEMFLLNNWGYGSSELGPNDDLSLSTGTIQFVLSVFAVVFALLSFKTNRKKSVLVIGLFATSLLILFMMHQKSSFIWSKLEFLWFLQFPWRFLAVSIFLLAIISSLGVSLIENKKLSYILGTTAIISVIFLHGSFFTPKNWLNISDSDKFSGKSWEKQLTISIFDYLPIYAKLPPTSKAPDLPEFLNGDVKFEDYKKGSDFQTAKMEVKKDSIVRLPLFDFPGMKVSLNNVVIDHYHDDCRGQEFCLGLITFKVRPGNYDFKVQLTNTPIRTLGNTFSVLSILTVSFLLFKYKKDYGKD